MEVDRANDLGYDVPVYEQIEDTHANYDAVIEMLLSSTQKPKVMVASHNQSSIQKATHVMRDNGIRPNDGHVFFGQLLGMSDHLTFTLGQV